MKEKINISLILKIFLYIQPILDLITSIMINYLNINLTIGMIVRFLFMLFIIFYYLFIKKVSKIKIYYLLSVLLFMIISIIIIIINKDIYVLKSELTNIIKILYFPILLTLIDKKDIKIKINDLINISLIYMLLIFIPNLFNISYNSYTQGKIGSVGLFNSGNEISAILSILNPFIIYYLFNKNNNYKKILLICLMLLTYFQMGSKIIIISLIISIAYNIYLFLKNNKVDKKYIYISLITILLLIILGLIIIPKTNFYYNIKLHLSYLEINSFKDVFTFKFINRFIFSDRLTYLINNTNVYLNSSILNKLFGIGTILNYATDSIIIKSIEMDLFDIFYSLGIIGFIIYIIPIIKNIKNKGIYMFSIILCFIIAILVGHTLVAPAVSIYLIYLMKSGEKH